MRPPNKEEFSKFKVVLDCMLVVIVKVLKKKPCHSNVI